MAMATPAPLATLARNRSNDFNLASYRQQRIHSSQTRTLKSSKSVDGLRHAARSHTTEPANHSLRRNFDDMNVASPSLTQTQLDTYGSTLENHNHTQHHYQPTISYESNKLSQSGH
ncbi:hypothetical protein BGZ49_005218, partial [Haplosporangium sp. Z 27]